VVVVDGDVDVGDDDAFGGDVVGGADVVVDAEVAETEAVVPFPHASRTRLASANDHRIMGARRGLVMGANYSGSGDSQR
jgi:hypothetical protein